MRKTFHKVLHLYVYMPFLIVTAYRTQRFGHRSCPRRKETNRSWQSSASLILTKQWM